MRALGELLCTWEEKELCCGAGRIAQLVGASTLCAEVVGSILGQGTSKNQPTNA